MRDESFNDPQVAKLLNNKFISVKIDRELNPALDDYLMTFLQMTRGFGGWPLNVFITPDGHPLVGLVYLPKDEFIELLNKLNEDWQQNNQQLKELAREAFEFSRHALSQASTPLSATNMMTLFLNAIRENADELQGGLGGQSKFPRPALLMSLLDFYQQKKDEWLAEFLQLTLEQIASKGLHDVIGGGFFRYTVDPLWHVPHFEKMLYTNAGLTLVYLRAYEIFNNQQYLNVAIETMEFMLREMWTDQGFISSLNAQDAQGIEGGCYVWSLDEMQKVLTTEQWNRVHGAWEFVEIENIGLLPVGSAQHPDWQKIKSRLYEKRLKNRPLEDDKILVSWNGYALSALAELVKLTGREDFKQYGNKLYKLLHARQSAGLARRVKQIDRHFIEDYVYLMRGMLDWQSAVGEKVNRADMVSLLEQSIHLFWTPSGWRLSDENILPVPAELVSISDAQLPSMEIVLLKLVSRLGVENNRLVQPVLRGFTGRIDARAMQNPASYASHFLYLYNRQSH